MNSLNTAPGLAKFNLDGTPIDPTARWSDDNPAINVDWGPGFNLGNAGIALGHDPQSSNGVTSAAAANEYIGFEKAALASGAGSHNDATGTTPSPIPIIGFTEEYDPIAAAVVPDGAGLPAPGNATTGTTFAAASAAAGTTALAGDFPNFQSVFATAGNVTINLQFSASAQAAGSAFMTGMQQAATMLAAAINLPNAITINLAVEFNEAFNATGPTPGAGGALGGPDDGTFETYQTVRTDLLANSPGDPNFNANSLPNTTTIGGQTNVLVWNAQLKAFGLLAGNNAALDGTADFGTGIPSTSLVGVALHELSHAMGRSPNGPEPDILDIFRFTSPGNYLFDGNVPATSSSYFSVDGGTTDLADYGVKSDPSDWLNQTAINGDAASPLTPNDPFDQYYIDGSTIQTLTAKDLQQLDVLGFSTVCFCRGTMIMSEQGEVAVEELAVGDLVRTVAGGLKPIVWIGMGRDLVTRANKLSRPVIVRQSALGENVPQRDLYLTHGHALYIDGALIPVENLINHRSILWDETVRVVEYYHIELEDHDVVLAEGAPAETYYDADNRAQFQNTRRGSQPGSAKPTYAPVLNGGDVVDRVWAELFEQTGGRAAGGITADPDIHLMIDGCRLESETTDDNAVTFQLPALAAGNDLLLRSRSGVPSLLGLSRRDHRRLGIAICRIELRQHGVASTYAHDAPLFAKGGCYPAEENYSWTDGELHLPARLFAHLDGPFSLTVHIERPGIRYPLPASVAQAA